MTTLQFPILSTQAYQDATAKAKALIRERVDAPQWAAFERSATRIHPRWFTGLILGALVAVMVFSFTISAGKQIASASMLFDNMPEKFAHLSTGWAGFSIVFMLLLSELGAVLFLIAAGTIAHDAPTWRGINPVAWMFRGFAGLCAAYAVVSNISVTLLDPVPAVGLLQWLTSIGIPITVLGLGTMLERLVVDALTQRGKQKVEYEIALRDYHALIANPETHIAWGQVLTSVVYEELTRLKKNREQIEATFAEIGAERSTLRAHLVRAEIQAHSTGNALALEASTNPFLSLPSPAQLEQNLSGQ